MLSPQGEVGFWKMKQVLDCRRECLRPGECLWPLKWIFNSVCSPFSSCNQDGSRCSPATAHPEKGHEKEAAISVFLGLLHACGDVYCTCNQMSSQESTQKPFPLRYRQTTGQRTCSLAYPILLWGLRLLWVLCSQPNVWIVLFPSSEWRKMPRSSESLSCSQSFSVAIGKPGNWEYVRFFSQVIYALNLKWNNIVKDLKQNSISKCISLTSHPPATPPPLLGGTL